MKRVLLVAVACAFAASPAMADLVLKYDMSNAQLSYNATTGKLAVTETGFSSLEVRVADNEYPFPVLDNTVVSGGVNFNFLLDLQLVDELGANNWSATGTMSFTDTSMLNNAVEAAVQTYNIERSGTSLMIQGYLGELGSNSGILVNRGSPWVFAGNGELSDPVAGATNQVTMFNPGSYDGGDLLTIRFGITGTLDSLFSANQTLSGGYVGGAVVPLP